ncbi:glycosyltransferase family 9 protein [Cetobacterium ceti]
MIKYFKKNYILESINLYIIRWILKIFYKNFFDFSKGKILVKSADGIGDILVRSKLAEMIIEKYGKENVYFLMQENYVSLGKLLGYNTIGYSRKERKKFFPRLKKMLELNKMGFEKYINIEFTNELTVGNLFIPERIGLIDIHPFVERNNKYYTRDIKIPGDIYIMEQIKSLGSFILNKKLEIMDITPDLKNIFSMKTDNNIVINVGSSSRDRVCSPVIMKEYIVELLKIYKNSEILLVGSGKNHLEYGNFLVENLKNARVKNLVNKTTLVEVFNLISGCQLFIGFDSGLYNFSYCVRKNTIGLFRKKGERFEHKVPWVRVITPDYKNEIIKDEKYKNIEINSISKEKFLENIEELRNEKSSHK